jgi:transposase, IS5 family
MKQATLGLNLNVKGTRKRVFLDEMNRVVPWAALVKLVGPHYPKGATGRPPMGIEVMLRTVNDLLTQQGLLLKSGTAIDATLISAPSSTKNADAERDPEMHQAKKGNQWHFGMKAHIGVDADSGLVHTMVSTAANVNDVTQAEALLHGAELDVFADAGYQGVGKRNPDCFVKWHVAMRPGKRRSLDKTKQSNRLVDQVEQLKASIRAKVEHPFRVIKRQFGYVKVRYRGLKKNHQQITTLFALSNLWMARKRTMILQG